MLSNPLLVLNSIASVDTHIRICYLFSLRDQSIHVYSMLGQLNCFTCNHVSYCVHANTLTIWGVIDLGSIQVQFRRRIYVERVKFKHCITSMINLSSKAHCQM